jgi:hypothetical protein
MYHGSRAGVPAAIQRTELQRLVGMALLSPCYVEISRLTLCVCVDRACDPSLYEPNLGINLEVSDLINNKKGNL